MRYLSLHNPEMEMVIKVTDEYLDILKKADGELNPMGMSYKEFFLQNSVKDINSLVEAIKNNLNDDEKVELLLEDFKLTPIQEENIVPLDAVCLILINRRLS